MDSTSIDGLVRFGWDETVTKRLSPFPGAVPGRVIRSDRGACLVATADGIVTVWWAGTPPVTGDWVAVADEHVVGIAERTSAIVRGNASESGDQTLAVNVDLVFVLHGLDRTLGLNRLERSLALVWGGGARPVVVLTKADIADDDLVDHQRVRAEGAAAGSDVVVTSTVDGRGCDRLAEMASAGTTVALMGASGVGKSTLGNRLVGDQVLGVGDTRGGDGKGRHTTVTRELVPTARGGVLIDTPGLRGLGLATDAAGVDLAFSDIAALAVACRYRDCRHAGEPGCAVVAEVAPRRLESYRKLVREQAVADQRAEFRRRRDEHRKSRRPYNRRDDW